MDGPIRGTHVPPSVAYLGIPYGRPPLGPLRFRPPLPAPKWTSPLDASSHRNVCYQAVDTMFPGFGGAEMWNPNRAMSEDCLYLNVWIPYPPPPQLMPVMVWIYGGGFYSGAASLDVYDGRILAASQRVVVVSMNYRVGALGFLALPGHPDAPGNAGLWDQRLALQWIQRNIRVFGGDPNAVTLFGESAGAASIGIHLLSPGSREYFHRAILQSGSPNGPWATIDPNEGRRRALKLGMALGCIGNDTEVVMCLRERPAPELVEGEGVVMPQDSVFRFPFVPVVDGEFLRDSPEVLLGAGMATAIDILLGAVRDEGTYFLVYGVPGFGKDNESLISRDEFLHGVRMGVPQGDEVVAAAVELQYTDWLDQENPVKNREALGAIVGDHNVVCPLMEFAGRWALWGRVYVYLFEHRASTLLWPQWMGVPHGYEIEFVFGQPLRPELNYTEEEKGLSRRMMEYWGNFARTGDPNGPNDSGPSRWPQFTLRGQGYARLNTAPLSQAKGLRAQACAFWTRFLPKLMHATGPMEEAEHQWRQEFHRWSSYMGRWQSHFEHYSRMGQCQQL
ncbi:acetylcholinesterase [Melopsittacus undulatus]|uniref:acetylcholinesterase n=1 Tax=Melopsittacus undulatus TaxID=13146 RepID=UPI00146C893E|nr:acetylcholinesterase [Melopsittacus undulatus]